MFGNFIYFILVLLIYLTYQPSDETYFSAVESFTLFFCLVLIFILFTRFQFRRIEIRISRGQFIQIDHQFSAVLLHQSIAAVVLFLLGGWSWVVWGVAVRTVFTYHTTWLVNSASHKWGYRNFETDDDSRNNWWVALISWGEGWHNNHHAHQRSAGHGMRWFEIDASYWSLRVLQWMRGALRWDEQRCGQERDSYRSLAESEVPSWVMRSLPL